MTQEMMPAQRKTERHDQEWPPQMEPKVGQSALPETFPGNGENAFRSRGYSTVTSTGTISAAHRQTCRQLAEHEAEGSGYAQFVPIEAGEKPASPPFERDPKRGSGQCLKNN